MAFRGRRSSFRRRSYRPRMVGRYRRGGYLRRRRRVRGLRVGYRL